MRPTVCSPKSGGFQCRCEDQYRWSCDLCQKYAPCDIITNDTCGCINAIPPDGQYCQSLDQHSELCHHISSYSVICIDSTYFGKLTCCNVTFSLVFILFSSLQTSPLVYRPQPHQRQVRFKDLVIAEIYFHVFT